MKNKMYFASIVFMMLAAAKVHSHSRWVVPSHTILSGDKAEVVSLDFSISNDIFHPDMAYGGDDFARVNTLKAKDKKQKLRNKIIKKLYATTRVTIVHPNGETNNKVPFVNLGRKSSAALLLEQSGTYKISIQQAPVLFTMFETAEGERGREFGGKRAVSSLLPDGAKNIKTLRVNSRVDTYLTRNGLTREVLKPVGKGLEVVSKTHFNELFVGEPTQFQLLFNGKPVDSGVSVKVTRNDTRYRNQRNTFTAKTQEKGLFTVPWGQAGMYLLEADLKAPSVAKGVDSEMYALYLTLEVNPE